MAASFGPFQPRVRFYWDATTFYEESNSLPDAALMPNLMVGITSWQQQVPLPAAYFASVTNPESSTGSLGYGQPNYWRLPLVPVPSASPIAISSGNFQRGAVALAANGVPIFNPRNNTGRVSYEIGELDAYGGHCGLADDYHYHIIPTHLSSRFSGLLGDDKAVAWSLDGYPIYGFVEPDGSGRQALDADGGHDIGSGWGYHYHAIGTTATDATHPYGTPQAPYLMSAFHGTVVNFGGQVDGQPEASPIRASGTGGYTASPVSGASIVAFKNPVALSTDGSGHLIENVGGVASADAYLMRVNIGGTNYDECWRINRGVNPRTLTITWRLAGATTTTTYTSTNTNTRLPAYPMGAWSETKLPDTSQTQDTTATFGEDADYVLNAQSFTDHGNGTITDAVTGLMWQKTDNGELTWENAVANALAVSIGGYSDWRLPTPAELFSIFNHQNNNPALNTTFFPSNPNGAAEYWWTSDVYGGSSTTNVWCSNAGGGLGPKPKSETISAGGTLRYHARYVRGAKPTNLHTYLNNLDGTITDTDTALMWTQLPAAALAWDSALSYAENLTLGGYSDWRLPNLKELETLTDYTLATATNTNGIKPALNRTMFAKTLTNCVLSSASTTVTCSDTSGLLPGMPLVDHAGVAGTYLSNTTPPTVVSVTNATTFVMSAAATASGSGLTLRALAPPTAFWSSTSLRNDTTKAWVVEFGINSAANPQRNTQGIISYDTKTLAYPVFAVRTATITTQIGVEQPGGASLIDGVSTVSYGNVAVGSTLTKTFTIRNSGSTSLTITGVTIDGPNFSVTAQPAATIAAGGSTTMDVRFVASTLGNKVAVLHIASSDTAVGAAFDLTLAGTGYIPPPAFTGVTTVPAVPSDVDTPTISATVTPASGATISSVQLTYSAGSQVTTTVFNETMTSTATVTGGWDGTGAVYPWTITSTAGAGNVKQSTAANHTSGAGGTCGLEFGRGSASAAATMAQTTNAIDATGTAGYVEFWAATSNLTAGLGWNFQVSTDNTNWATRLSESDGTNHTHQLYHYDFAAAERVSTLRLRYQFIGNTVGGPTGPKTYVDDIKVAATTGVAPVTVTMSGASGGGLFASPQIPAQTLGTTVSYTINATDSNGAASSATGSYTTGPAPTITTGATLVQATLGGTYSQTLAASGGTGATYTWSVNAGSTLPPGLALSSAGVLSGTANTPGTYSFTLRVTDTAGRIATKAFTLVVSTTTLPNVVIMLTDDQGWGDVSYHTPAGQVAVQTPNMARIGTEGIRLERFYPTPICSTSRCSLLTGRNTLRTNSNNARGVDLSEHMMPQTFKAAGYQTFMCGKWHLGGWNNDIYTATLNGATVTLQHEGPEYHPRSRGWDFHLGQYGGAINYFTHNSIDPGLAPRLDWWLNGAPRIDTTDLQGNGGYSTDLLADQAISQIVNRDKTRPMLLYLAFNGVHAGVQAPASYISKYAGLGVTDTARRTLCAAVDCMDVAMGRVLATLDSEGIANNTVVLYMSDNGGNEATGSLNDPLRGTKTEAYEGGIHTPAAIRWPGVLAAGVTSNQYVWIGDIFPTLCAALGIAPQNTKPFDGMNLWPALQGISAANPNGTTRPVPLVTSSSTPAALNTFTDPVNGGSKMFKLIRNRSGNTFTNELFNLTDDPYETADLLLGANASSYAAIVSSLTGAITSLSAEAYPPYIGPPAITQSVQQGNPITLYAAFTSYGKVPSVQWRKSGATIAGATSYAQVTDSGTAVNGVYVATLSLANLNSTDTASYDLVVTSANGATTSQAGTLTVIHPVSTLGDGLPDTWKIAHGIDPNSTAAINGPLGDLERDGRVNLIEYAFNGDPRAPESNPIHATAVIKPGDGLKYLELSYPRRIGALDLIYSVETSDDLVTWSPSGTEPVSLGATGDGITETVTVRVLPALAGGGKKLARVKVAAQ